MADFRKPIPCPSCDNPEMNQGTVTVSAPEVIIVKWCDCGQKLILISPDERYDYSVQRDLKKEEAE